VSVEASHDAAGESRPSILRKIASFLRGEETASAQMRESIEEAIEEADREADFSAPEQKMLANLLKFGDLRVSDVMIPRADIVAVAADTSFADFVARFRDEQHSRLVVYGETLDDPLGLVHLKDVLNNLETQADGSLRWKGGTIAEIKREILFVPPSMPLIDLLLKMQTAHTHLALVIDEFGGTDGLVSIEDVIEEIVGDIADEHDETADAVRKLEDGSFVADGRLDLEDFRNQTGLALAPEDPDSDVDTLGGLVAWLLGRLPQRGEVLTDPAGFEFEVLEADPRRVKRLRIKPPVPGPADDGAGGPSA
jgi:magnesium and cobalt transporter